MHTPTIFVCVIPVILCDLLLLSRRNEKSTKKSENLKNKNKTPLLRNSFGKLS